MNENKISYYNLSSGAGVGGEAAEGDVQMRLLSWKINLKKYLFQYLIIIKSMQYNDRRAIYIRGDINQCHKWYQTVSLNYKEYQFIWDWGMKNSIKSLTVDATDRLSGIGAASSRSVSFEAVVRSLTY